MDSTHCAIDLRFLAAAVLAAASLQSFADSGKCDSRGSQTRVAVLELYTSEGCDSCPPADRWVSTLPARGFTLERIIPLAFHVDYWDQLGWPDRMARAQFSARQRKQAERNHSPIIYTPQLLLNGADLPHLAESRFSERLSDFNRRPTGAELLLRQRLVPSGVEVELEVRPLQAAGGHAKTYIAITENGLQNTIRAGENQGRLLRHDFVVRDLAGPLPMDDFGRVHWKSTMALPLEWKRPDLSLVAFAQDEQSGDILQALHAPLCIAR